MISFSAIVANICSQLELSWKLENHRTLTVTCHHIIGLKVFFKIFKSYLVTVIGFKVSILKIFPELISNWLVRFTDNPASALIASMKILEGSFQSSIIII